MALYKRKRSPYWWYSFKVDGQRIFESTGTTDKKLAEEIYHLKRSETLKGKHFPAKTKIKLKEMVQLYLDGYSKIAKKSYRNDLSTAKVILGFFNDCLLSDITPYRIEQYRAHRLEEVSRAKINREHAFLRHVFTKALEWEKWVGDNPAKKIRPFKEERKPERYLTSEERQRLLSASPDFLKPIILVALKAGMRMSEILNLKWEDVDLKRGIIYVRQTKAGKMRGLPLHQQLKNVLSGISKRSAFVFCDEKGEKLSKNGIFRGAFERAVKEAKIFSFVFHDLRHSFASELIMKGVDIKTVQEYLGHSSVAVTERYLHVAPNQKRDAIQILSQECDTGVTLENKGD